MARNAQPLDAGQSFPELTFDTVGGGTLNLPADLEGDFAIVLFYRGKWCPFCNRQLKAYQRQLEKLEAEGIKVVALSADTLEDAQAVVDQHGVTFPVAYGLDVAQVAESIGAFYDEAPSHVPNPYLHSTGFILAPDGSVVVSVYSSGDIGRLEPADALGMIQYVKSH